MSTKYSDLQRQFETIHTEADDFLESVKDREMTADERTKQDLRYATLEGLRHQMEKIKTDEADAALAAFNSGNVILGRNPKGKDEYEISEGQGGISTALLERGRFGRDTARALKFGESTAKYLGIAKPGAVGIGEFCRAAVLGPRTPAERFALGQSTDSAGGFTVPVDLAASVIDGLRDESVFTKAGASVIPLRGYQNKMVRIAEDPTPGWRAENAAVAVDDAVFEAVEFTPKTLAVIVKASRELLEDSLNINEALGLSFAGAMAAEVDRVCGWGSGTGAEPLGIVNTSGILEVTSTTNGDELADYTKFLDAIYQLQSNNVTPNAAIMSPREARVVNGFTDTTGQPLRRPDALVNLPFLVSNKVPVNQTKGTSNDASSIIVGDFTKLLIGMRTEMRIEVLKERFADNLQYGFLVWLRMDVHPSHKKAFAKITGIIPE